MKVPRVLNVFFLSEFSSFTSNELNVSIDRNKFNLMNFSLTNSRSLPPKIHSLITAFSELDLSFMMVTETWIKNTKETTRNMKDLADAENIELICKNRPTRGGGVCIAYDNKKCKLARFPLPTSSFEVVCAVGKVVGFSKKIAIIAVYIPPKYTLQQVGALCDYISDSIEKVKRDL